MVHCLVYFHYCIFLFYVLLPGAPYIPFVWLHIIVIFAVLIVRRKSVFFWLTKLNFKSHKRNFGTMSCHLSYSGWSNRNTDICVGIFFSVCVCVQPPFPFHLWEGGKRDALFYGSTAIFFLCFSVASFLYMYNMLWTMCNFHLNPKIIQHSIL